MPFPSPVDDRPGPEGDALVLESLTKVFRQEKAVDALSLRVARGRFFGFLGPNGAGKSTTIKMLTGLLRPTSGDAVDRGRPASARTCSGSSALIGVLPEELPLYERLTGEEYLHFAGRMYGLAKDETRAAHRGAARVPAPRRRPRQADRRLLAGHEEEGGPGRRAHPQPAVLFLDEPLNGIDPVSGRVVTDLLRRLAQKGVTLFFTTHVLDVVERLCDEVAVIDRGRIVAQGTLDEIRAQREMARDASLEDVFLKLVSADVQREDLSWIG